MNAAKMDHWEIIEQLIAKNPSLLNDVDEHGDTALHLACLNGQYDGAERLIYYGSDVLARNYADETPLDSAAKTGQLPPMYRVVFA